MRETISNCGFYFTDISNIEAENNRESAEVNIEFIQAENLDPCKYTVIKLASQLLDFF